jgi:predicted nucleic acid-binding Zn ribbon protein
MPDYTFKCPDCQAQDTRHMAIQDRDAPQKCFCGALMVKTVPEGVGAVLRGDSWPGKSMALRKQMADRRSKVGRREAEWAREAHPGGRLIPNVGGEQVDTWEEAGKLATSLGKDSSEYQRRARKEKKA